MPSRPRRASASEKSRPTREEIVAVHVLTHEAMHLSGVKQESIAECDAMQRDTKTAARLSSSAIEAAGLAAGTTNGGATGSDGCATALPPSGGAATTSQVCLAGSNITMA